jgi:hypothetical protein
MKTTQATNYLIMIVIQMMSLLARTLTVEAKVVEKTKARTSSLSTFQIKTMMIVNRTVMSSSFKLGLNDHLTKTHLKKKVITKDKKDENFILIN